MSKVDQKRLLELRQKSELTPKEQSRLEKLEQDYVDLQETRKVCPFRTDSPFPLCTKAGGVCSIRLVEEVQGKVQPVKGER
ncbi:MAG: NotI family restriction endonuclease, partial [Pseudomonadota bacterium]